MRTPPEPGTLRALLLIILVVMGLGGGVGASYRLGLGIRNRGSGVLTPTALPLQPDFIVLPLIIIGIIVLLILMFQLL